MNKTTKVVNIGNVKIGGGNPVLIQSMTNTDTRDVDKTVKQIHMLENAGCEIIRVAVLDEEAAKAIYKIKNRINIPLVADIHFDYRLALKSIDSGVDKLRINPGNIGDFENVRKVAAAAKQKGIPIRVGVNSGSVEKDILTKYGGVTAEGLCESAMRHVKMLEQCDFDDIVVAIKSSDVPMTIKAYEIMSGICDYPLHIGITEAGTLYSGAIKSAVGIGAMLSRSIGDTMRVSLTGDPVEEIKCAKEILKALGLRDFGAKLISCPTCGRAEVDLISLANRIDGYLSKITKNITVAVMGCVVNGPGEAKHADVGIAGGKGSGVIFKKGQIVRKVSEEDMFQEFVKEIESLCD
ncbi:MAG: flavodoxin-dependent (E)-4-hydroxy-3-methylbut-2-enyl-diphosphate synthase [Defluviitaleaceae bacterium]|nr:flavodoxin-dependent (E)-4-hydroxy-3-methylbut-2-enyl-diphosphate synthase [Defluviitaleaceae bacterium]